MQYIVDHIPVNEYKRPGIKGDKTSITVHNTGNPGVPAQNYQKNWSREDNTRYASAHIVVDTQQAIECIPLDEMSYHCGRTEGNMHSIGIEICEIDGAEYAAAELIAKMLKERGWGIDRVTTHQAWSGKYCPRLLLPKWDWFIDLVQSKMKEEEESMMIIVPSGIGDKGAAQVLADNIRGAVLDWGLVTPNDHVIQVGGPVDAKPLKPCKSFKIVSGADRLSTAEAVCKYIREGK